jgi:hypothetical protein
MGQRYGSAGRDRLWSHPDLLPTSDDLDEPMDFVARQDLDDELTALTASDAEKPSARDDRNAGDDDTTTPERPGDEEDGRA